MQPETKKIIEFFLENGVDINYRNSYGRTCLHFAAGCCFRNPNPEIVEFLCERGADIEAKTTQGFTPADESTSDTMKTFLKEFVLVDGSIKPAKRGKTEEVCEEEEEEEEGSKKRKRREENEIDGEKGPKKPRTEED
eukprot:CAMPEP_0201479290 /NCGR_PEP_ID=MMETSP0151_2-20130828/3993_1 /ASSEMBLY_ACC=CAM_ASM_000257 /TAXON_ID=200890 /ORGANISM="Paramoeba atlantica, Strain 621/1 / CCAP 1560/9" /LENGTH=136 /DNA_ID=CAMNT_0047860699 /DNA_START=829 /DNA_END=1239 /DNA_ORIENTATION=+